MEYIVHPPHLINIVRLRLNHELHPHLVNLLEVKTAVDLREPTLEEVVEVGDLTGGDNEPVLRPHGLPAVRHGGGGPADLPVDWLPHGQSQVVRLLPLLGASRVSQFLTETVAGVRGFLSL